MENDSFFLSDLVTDRPDPSLDFDEDVCPLCGSTRLEDGGTIQTLLGWIGSEEAKLSEASIQAHPDNPNHSSRQLICTECGLPFSKEVKKGNVWIAVCLPNKLLAGVPNCFEHYSYTCCHCGGLVRRHYTDMGGEKKAISLTHKNVDGVWKKLYRTFFRCDDCGKEVETTQDYYHVKQQPKETTNV